MTRDEAIELTRGLIDDGEFHPDYMRTVELAKDYKAYRTGKGIDHLMIRFTPNEDIALFNQRLRISRAITPAVAASLERAFMLAARNNRIKREITGNNPKKIENVEQMLNYFSGQNKGLNYWMKTRFPSLGFSDPNAWVVVEWKNEGLNKLPKPQPFEVPACKAINFSVENGVTNWLLVRQDIMFCCADRTSNRTLPGWAASVATQVGRKPKKKPGFRYTLYEKDNTIVFEQVDPARYERGQEILNPNEELVRFKSDEWYIQRTYTPKLGFTPAFRVGYAEDEVTDGRTFVNGWHMAESFFFKSLKTVSEFDLTMCMHTFPQKLVYVQACAGESPTKRCHSGYLPNGQICKACNGSGVKTIKTTQEAIEVKMPDDPAKMVDLDKMIAYKSPPIELVKFQNEMCLQLERQAHQAVYNSQIFIKPIGPSSEGTAFMTATESNNTMQAVYDTLEPFTEKFSDFWKEITTTLAGIANDRSIKVTHVFPGDLKLKTMGMLMTERKSASESGANPFILETLDDDIVDVQTQDDELRRKKYYVQKKFRPFTGLSPTERMAALSSPDVLQREKVIYMNFDSIMRECEITSPDFYITTNFVGQRKLFNDIADKWLNLVRDQTQSVNANTFRQIMLGDDVVNEPIDEEEEPEDNLTHTEDEA